ALVEGRRYFAMGYSWGGFESLLIPTWPSRIRTATRWEAAGHTLRIHVGLEDPDDLIGDLEEGFKAMAGGS
ncbi:MAG: PLP-dependent transferase, partial [Candidatus Competibacteraceae bacterium]|nr:PLP-dependent transferase [Candidatus Competibacteraceae bacterium]